MAIELTSPTQAHKAAASAPTNDKKSGQSAGDEVAADAGFSALMQSLAVTDAPSATAADSALLAPPVDTPDATAAAEAGLVMSAVALPVVPVEGVAVAGTVCAGTDAMASQSDALRSVKNAALGVLAQPNGGKVQMPAQMATQLQASTLPEPNTPAPLSFATLMMHRNALQAAASQVPFADVKDQRATALPMAMTPVADPALTLLASAAGEVQRVQERPAGKSGSGSSGGAGFDVVFGSAAASVSRSDAVFVVPPATATVADNAVAETVSYWVSHGVQTAELTLDGFGDSPVEVRILLNGDQAQIDFRTDQSGVRHVLESASAQLKEMLSGQGLQLAGVSVGASGQGAGESGEHRRARPGAQRVALVKEETLSPVSNAATYPSAGRSLDLFV